MGTARSAPEVTNPGGANPISVIPEAVAQAAVAPVRTLDATTPLDVASVAVTAPPTLKTAQDAKPVLTQIASIADPFAGFVGHCFFHFCQGLELLVGSMHRKPAPAEIAAESLLKSSTHPNLRYWGTCSLGTVCCTVVAAGLIPIFHSSSIKSFLPLAFLLIVVLVAFRFGRLAGILGTVAAAFVFADFLFEPAGLAVADPVARNHLLWMLIVGVLVSDLLVRFKMRRRAHRLYPS